MTQQKKLLLQRIYLPLLISIFIAGVTGGLHIYRKIFIPQGSSYTPLVTVGVDIHTVDEVFYAQRIQRAATGNLLVGDRHFFEYRNTAYIFPTFTPFIFGLITKILGDISWTFILADVFLPPITFLLLYYVIFRGTGNILVSVAGAITATFYDIFQELIAAVLRFSPAYFFERIYIGDGRVLHITRFEAQEFIFPFILIAIICLWRALEKKSLKMAVVSGIIYGLHPYTYPYSTLFFAVGAGLLFIFTVLKRAWENAGYILATLGIGALMSIPYLITYTHFRQLPVAADVLRRMTIIEHYSPLQFVRQFGHYFLFLGVAFYISRKNPLLRYSTFFLLGVLLALGFFPYGKIYHLDIYLKIWFPVVLFIVTHELVKLSRSLSYHAVLRKIFVIGNITLFLLVLGGGTIKHLSSAIPSSGNFTIDQSILESYTWIKRNTMPDSVILSPSLRTNRELPTFVPNFIFLGRADFTFASNEDLINRALIAFKLFGYSSEAVKRVFTGLDRGVSLPYKGPYTPDQIETLGIYHFLGFTGASPEMHKYIFGSNNGLQTLIGRYEKTPKFSAREIAKMYKLDYIYIGPAEKNLLENKQINLRDATEVYKNPKVTIYKVLQ